MDNKLRCQSCGMPLADGFFGTEKDGSETRDFCKFCYQDGEYVQPELTVDDMITMSIDNMTQDLNIDEAKAKELANSIIPKLKRWSTN